MELELPSLQPLSFNEFCELPAKPNTRRDASSLTSSPVRDQVILATQRSV